MCGRFSLHTVRERIAEHFDAEEFSETRIFQRWNVAPSQEVLVVRASEAGRRELTFLRWGLVPHWAKEGKFQYSTINARAETVASKPAFRDSFRRRRCLIPADGFYEWQPAKPRKQPWFIRVKGADLFAFAGLWDRWRGAGGEVVESFTIVVTDANDLLRPIHDRMPVILVPADYQAWLDPSRFEPGRLAGLLRQYPADKMDAYRVSSGVNTPANDDPSCVKPLDA
jgi:putative SOS response-associated peptidase YedK